MLLFIPLGADSDRPSLPRATVTLIALNVLVFLFTSRFDTQKVAAQEAELERVAAWSIGGLPEHHVVRQRAGQNPSALAFLDKDGQWASELDSSDLRERLSFCLADYRKLKAGHPFYRFGFVPAEGGLGRLLSHQFLHADVVHLLFNMLFLWAMGGLLELTLGAAIFLPCYLSSGVVAALTHGAFHPGSAEPAVGASGAVAGMMGMFLVLHLRQPIRMALVAAVALAPRIHIFSVPAYVFLGLWLLEQLFFASFGTSTLGVAFMAHIGGFAFGALLAFAFRIWPRPAPKPREGHR